MGADAGHDMGWNPHFPRCCSWSGLPPRLPAGQLVAGRLLTLSVVEVALVLAAKFATPRYQRVVVVHYRTKSEPGDPRCLLRAVGTPLAPQGEWVARGAKKKRAAAANPPPLSPTTSPSLDHAILPPPTPRPPPLPRPPAPPPVPFPCPQPREPPVSHLYMPRPWLAK